MKPWKNSRPNYGIFSWIASVWPRNTPKNGKSRVKDKTNNQCLVGAFYGGYGCTSYLEDGVVSGALRVLESGVVDFLSNPAVYENRMPGGVTGQRGIQDSLRLRGNMFVCEEDTRTHLASELNREFTGTHTLADSLTVMKRDFARNLCEDLQGWWFDMAPPGDRGWYDHPDVLDLIRRQQEIAQFAYSTDRRKPTEIAFIFDEESTHCVSQNTTRDACHYWRLLELHRIGAPIDFYFHNDLADPRMGDYKLYVFVNVFCLTQSERKAVDAKVKRGGQVALWMYAPGFICPDGRPKLSEDYISELVGMTILRDEGPCEPKFKLLEIDHPLLASVNRDRVHGYLEREIISGGVASLPPGPAPRSLLYPRFYPQEMDPNVTVLGRFSEGDAPALAVREFADWTSVYCGSKVVGSDVLRSLAVAAGCHIYCDSDDALYANRRFVAIHASYSGTKRIQFARTCNPYEVYQRKLYGQGVESIEVAMTEGETLMFHLDGPC